MEPCDYDLKYLITFSVKLIVKLSLKSVSNYVLKNVCITCVCIDIWDINKRNYGTEFVYCNGFVSVLFKDDSVAEFM